MKRFATALAALPLLVTVALAEPSQLAWDELIDQSVQDFEDPFATLEYENIERLVSIARLRGGIEGLPLDDAARAEAEAEIEVLVGELAKQGYDADWLISQRWVVAERRERAATSGNPALDGLDIVISGYAIPAPPADDGTNVVYLVPERGMCSHMPPPPSNQMIRARLPDGWTPSVMHEPVRLTGVLSIAAAEHTFTIVDGPVAMRSSFMMDVGRVETIEDMNAASQQTNDWAASLVARMRASGQLSRQTDKAYE